MDNQTNPPYSDPYPDIMSDLKENQTKKSKKSLLKIATFIVAPTFVFLMLLGTLRSGAAQLTTRSVTQGNSTASASTYYEFAFTTASTATIQSFQADICTTASGTCTLPSGTGSTDITTTSSVIDAGNTDLSGTWTASNATNGSIRASATGASSTNSGVAKKIRFNTITNPSTTGTTFFARITTYSDNAYSVAVDTGTVAFTTAGAVNVSAAIDESLSLTINPTTINIPAPVYNSSSGTSTNNNHLSASTNATNGFNIKAYGSAPQIGSTGLTLTCMSSGGTSSTSTEQFGIRAAVNTASGTGTATVPAGYASPNYGAGWCASGGTSPDTVASANGPMSSAAYNVTYLTNASATTEAGTYTTTVNYFITGAF